MVDFSAGAVMAMLALIESTIIALFIFVWDKFATENWVKTQIHNHTLKYHKNDRD